VRYEQFGQESGDFVLFNVGAEDFGHFVDVDGSLSLELRVAIVTGKYKEENVKTEVDVTDDVSDVEEEEKKVDLPTFSGTPQAINKGRSYLADADLRSSDSDLEMDDRARSRMRALITRV